MSCLGRMVYKRYQYWGKKDGKVQKLWTQFFPWNSPSREKVQLKGYKGDDLLNEYKEE